MAKEFIEIFDTFKSVMDLLRNPEFQDLLENYERAKSTFMIGYEITDEIHSDVLFEARGKSALKPEDYLLEFAKFIKEKEKEIEAISILLSRPKNWNTKALNELKKALKENNFGEYNLSKAHKIVYHKELVDIISMVKHAAKDSAPLFSPEERVNLAISKVTNGLILNPEQQKWMGYIKEHLKQNMTIDENDLQEVPAFVDHGGLAKFKRVFPDNYVEIIKEINSAVAA